MKLKDIFRTHKCEKCKCQFSKNFETCPRCGEANTEYVERKQRNSFANLDIYRGIIALSLFLISNLIFYPYIMPLIYKAGFTTILSKDEFNLYGLIIVQFVTIAITLGLYWDHLKDLFKSFTKPKSILIGLGIGVVGVLLNAGLGLLTKNFAGANNNQSAIQNFININPAITLIASSLLGPLGEEIAFRVGGTAVFNKFGNKTVSKIISYGATAILFALVHVEFIHTTNLVAELISLPIYIILGLLFAFAYDFFGFSASFTAHTVNNFIPGIISLLTALSKNPGASSSLSSLL